MYNIPEKYVESDWRQLIGIPMTDYRSKIVLESISTCSKQR
jgi:hypothetical protein